jgi:hypothetical protein
VPAGPAGSPSVRGERATRTPASYDARPLSGRCLHPGRFTLRGRWRTRIPAPYDAHTVSSRGRVPCPVHSPSGVPVRPRRPGRRLVRRGASPPERRRDAPRGPPRRPAMSEIILESALPQDLTTRP